MQTSLMPCFAIARSVVNAGKSVHAKRLAHVKAYQGMSAGYGQDRRFQGTNRVWSDDYGFGTHHHVQHKSVSFQTAAAIHQVAAEDPIHTKVVSFAVKACDFLGDVTARVTDAIQTHSPGSNRIAVELCVRMGTGILLLSLARSMISVIMAVGGIVALAMCSNAAIHLHTAASEANKDFRAAARARRRTARYQAQSTPPPPPKQQPAAAAWQPPQQQAAAAACPWPQQQPATAAAWKQQQPQQQQGSSVPWPRQQQPAAAPWQQPQPAAAPAWQQGRQQPAAARQPQPVAAAYQQPYPQQPQAAAPRPPTWRGRVPYPPPPTPNAYNQPGSSYRRPPGAAGNGPAVIDVWYTSMD